MMMPPPLACGEPSAAEPGGVSIFSRRSSYPLARGHRPAGRCHCCQSSPRHHKHLDTTSRHPCWSLSLLSVLASSPQALGHNQSSPRWSLSLLSVIASPPQALGDNQSSPCWSSLLTVLTWSPQALGHNQSSPFVYGDTALLVVIVVSLHLATTGIWRQALVSLLVSIVACSRYATTGTWRQPIVFSLKGHRPAGLYCCQSSPRHHRHLDTTNRLLFFTGTPPFWS